VEEIATEKLRHLIRAHDPDSNAGQAPQARINKITGRPDGIEFFLEEMQAFEIRDRSDVTMNKAKQSLDTWRLRRFTNPAKGGKGKIESTQNLNVNRSIARIESAKESRQ
jgi:hypothetical protein